MKFGLLKAQFSRHQRQHHNLAGIRPIFETKARAGRTGRRDYIANRHANKAHAAASRKEGRLSACLPRAGDLYASGLVLVSPVVG